MISLSSPLLVGIYKEKKLIKTYSSIIKTSESLPSIFQEILCAYECKNIYFTKGPGSFMSIKITYIFLSTLCISLNCSLFASDGFVFNNNSPIKAVGNNYFVKINDIISLKKINDTHLKMNEFSLPDFLYDDIFSTDNSPLYILPAI